ncbi:MAG: hypothetical protein HOG19_10730 [Gammaproteobacteria bacterium]|nr:hypothetical protein [Gammaproteobacteria bacterium]
MKELLDITLPIQLTNSNDGQGRAWFNSAKTRQVMERDLLALGQRRKPFEQKVKVVVTRILGKGQRFWDSSSVLRGNYKQLEDAMVSCGWFTDDSTRYIDVTIGMQDDTQRKSGPATRMQIFDAS